MSQSDINDSAMFFHSTVYSPHMNFHAKVETKTTCFDYRKLNAIINAISATVHGDNPVDYLNLIDNKRL
jgi:hypothetical protein